MKYTLAFDVYGTLINTSGVKASLNKIVGDRAGAFMELWRNKQLEYSFRRGLMNSYVDFSICTREAMDYTASVLDIALKADEIGALLNAYKVLPAFDDVADCLKALSNEGYPIYAFSNGSAAAVSALLHNSNIAGYFNGVVSVEEVKTFKPNPVVYQFFNQKTASTPATSWLISGNSFDCIGALNHGMHAAWVNRSQHAVFDPWELQPTATIAHLGQLLQVLDAHKSSV